VSESAWSQDLGPVRLNKKGKPKVGGVVEPLASALDNAGVQYVRTLTLGHLLRGGPAVAADRLLARRFAAVATEEVLAGRSCIASVRRGSVVPVPVQEAFTPRRFLTAEEIEMYRPLIIGE
jgi:6-phosphofructokinase